MTPREYAAELLHRTGDIGFSPMDISLVATIIPLIEADVALVERKLIVTYLRHLATLRPADARGLRVSASDIEVLFHRDPELNPEAGL